jgi:hypothetical protein
MGDSGRTSPALPSRRAPRLDARTYLAPYITRRGRFRRVDPARGRPLPGLARIVGALGWAVLLGESLRRARKAARAQGEPVEGLNDEAVW